MTEKRGCAFTGHRNIYDALQKGLDRHLIDIIEELAALGTEVFYTGGAIGFDTLAAKTVLKLRQRLGIKLCVVVPFLGQENRYGAEDRRIYRSILADADDVITINSAYTKNAFYARNRYMVDMSEVCVAFLESDSGGTAYTVKYAERKGKRVINLAEQLSDCDISSIL